MFFQFSRLWIEPDVKDFDAKKWESLKNAIFDVDHCHVKLPSEFQVSDLVGKGRRRVKSTPHLFRISMLES